MTNGLYSLSRRNINHKMESPTRAVIWEASAYWSWTWNVQWRRRPPCPALWPVAWDPATSPRWCCRAATSSDWVWWGGCCCCGGWVWWSWRGGPGPGCTDPPMICPSRSVSAPALGRSGRTAPPSLLQRDSVSQKTVVTDRKRSVYLTVHEGSPLDPHQALLCPLADGNHLYLFKLVHLWTPPP